MIKSYEVVKVNVILTEDAFCCLVN